MKWATSAGFCGPLPGSSRAGSNPRRSPTARPCDPSTKPGPCIADPRLPRRRTATTLWAPLTGMSSATPCRTRNTDRNGRPLRFGRCAGGPAGRPSQRCACCSSRSVRPLCCRSDRGRSERFGRLPWQQWRPSQRKRRLRRDAHQIRRIQSCPRATGRPKPNLPLVKMTSPSRQRTRSRAQTLLRCRRTQEQRRHRMHRVAQSPRDHHA